MTHSFFVPKKQKHWSLFLILLIMLTLSIWLNPAIGRTEEGFNIVSMDQMSASDVELPYVRAFGDDTRRMAIAGCYGPFFKYTRNDNWLADFISLCGTGIFKVEELDIDKDKRNTIATFGGELFNAYGLRGHISYDIQGNEWYWGAGFSGLSLWGELTKRLEDLWRN